MDYIASEVEVVKETLKIAVPGFDDCLEKGQIEIIPYTHWYIKEDFFDSDRVLNGRVEKLNQALAKGYDGLRLAGDTFWLGEKNWNNFVDYEEEIDRVLGNYKMIALCTYCLDKCNASEIIDVVINHRFALIKREGKWEQIESSKRKRAEEALQKQAALISLSPDGIIIRQLDGTISFWSQGAQSLYGWTNQDVIGQQTHTLMKTRFPQPLEQIDKQVQKTGYWSGELIHLTKDGRQIIVQSRWQAKLGEQGNVEEILESNVDITERKRSEEKLRQAYESLQVQTEKLKSQAEEIQVQNEELQSQAEELQETNEALRRSEKRFELLNEANALLLSSKDPVSVIQTIAEKVMHHLNCDVFLTMFSTRHWEGSVSMLTQV